MNKNLRKKYHATVPLMNNFNIKQARLVKNIILKIIYVNVHPTNLIITQNAVFYRFFTSVCTINRQNALQYFRRFYLATDSMLLGQRINRVVTERTLHRFYTAD